MPLTELPADLAEPLHMLGPEAAGPGGPALAALAAAALAWLFFRRRRTARPEPSPGPPTPHRPSPSMNRLEAEIEELRSVFTATGNYRRGCHALAEALRRAIAPRHGVAFEALTASEIAREVGDGATARTLVLLEGLQFRPEEPSGEEFTQACDTAIATARNAPELRR